MESSVRIEMMPLTKEEDMLRRKKIRELTTAAFGTVFIDSIFTPIVNVQYTIDNFRVEQKTDCEKLIFNIQTDGSIHPKGIKEAS